MVTQTLLPAAWVVVSDGSTDRTDEIVGKYASEYPWIVYVRLPLHRDRQFAAKVGAFNEGYRRLSKVEYEVIGNLDADITFEPDYFEYLIHQFAEYPDLGVAGTPFVENGVQYDYRFTNIEHVSGACQLFRRECYEDIGGYTAVKAGGIDWIAVTTARMKGWRTRTFTEKVCDHHRKMGAGTASTLGLMFRRGKKDYALGGHPLWQIFRSLYQMSRKPYVLGGFLLLLGFVWSAMLRSERPISIDLLRFNRREQMKKLRVFFMKLITRHPEKQAAV